MESFVFKKATVRIPEGSIAVRKQQYFYVGDIRIDQSVMRSMKDLKWVEELTNR